MNIALIAHDSQKQPLSEWVSHHGEFFERHTLTATSTTGAHLERAGFKVKRMLSGPLGGDLQIGSLISSNEIDMLIFLCDSLAPQAHDVDIKALFRIASLKNIPFACNLATASLLIGKDHVVR